MIKKKKQFINLFLLKEKNKKNDIKKQLGKLIEHVIYLYKTKYNRYPLNINELKEISRKDQQGKVLEQFYSIYQQDIENIMLEFFTNNITDSIDNFCKEYNRYPSISNLNNDIVETLKKLDINESGYNILITDFIINKIMNVSKTIKMKQLFKEEYLKNTELFKEFIFMNIDKKKKYKEFEENGKKIKNIIENIENQLVGHMENGIHADKSVSVSNKYRKYIQSIFPMYNNIGVKVKKMNKKEMQEYIKKMNNK